MDKITLDKDYIDSMNNLLGDEARSFFAEYSKPAYSALRLNTKYVLSEAMDEIRKYTIDAVPWSYDGYYTSGTPGHNVLHEAGAYYIQEPSAMAVVGQIRVSPDDVVLDLCAAPGGKTTTLSTLLTGGVLVSNEIVPNRARVLSDNVIRLGLDNVIVLNESSHNLASKLPSAFNKVLVDAPCSGEGMFRKDPDAISEWSSDIVSSCAERSYDILCDAYTLTRAGGTITYSTCTFELDENERNIAKFLDTHPDCTLLDPIMYDGFTQGVDVDNTGRCTKCIRLYPNRIKGEGHFIATILKSGNDDRYIPRSKTRCDRRAIDAFYKFCSVYDIKYHFYDNYTTFGDELYSVPLNINLEKVKVVSPGIDLGTYSKGVFTPSHHLAKILSRDTFPHIIDLDHSDTIRYLSGEVLKCDEDNISGWVLLSYLGLPLGFGKASGGVIKNHYPKHLRLRNPEIFRQ